MPSSHSANLSVTVFSRLPGAPTTTALSNCTSCGNIVGDTLFVSGSAVSQKDYLLPKGLD